MNRLESWRILTDSRENSKQHTNNQPDVTANNF